MYEKWSIGINIIVLLLMVFSVVVSIRKNNTSMFSYDFLIKFQILYLLPFVFVMINVFMNIVFKLSITFWIVTVIIPIIIGIIIHIISFCIDKKYINKIRSLHSKYNLEIKSFIVKTFESKSIKISTDNIYVFFNYQDNIKYCKVSIDKNLPVLESNNLIKILKKELSNKYPEFKFDIIV